MNNPFQITTTYRLDQLEKKLSSLEASLSFLGQRLTIQDKAVDRLVKQKEIRIEEAERPVIQVPRHLIENKSRKKEVVAERYACWERLDRAGLRPYEIAQAFQCDHGSVAFAKKQGFKSGWMLRAERARLKA